MGGITGTHGRKPPSRRRGRVRTNSGRQSAASRAPTEIGIWCARACRRMPTRRRTRKGLERRLLLAEMRLVFRRVEQPTLLARILEPQLHHPAVAIGRGVHERGLLVETRIDLDDLTRHR